MLDRARPVRGQVLEAMLRPGRVWRPGRALASMRSQFRLPDMLLNEH